MSAPVTATCTEVGNTSFEDCDAFTWSFGCTAEPSFAVARVASTSFMFMFEHVPEPVWYTSTGNWSVVLARDDLVGGGDDRVARSRARACRARSFAIAAALLMRARAAICAGSRPDAGDREVLDSALGLCAGRARTREPSPRPSCRARSGTRRRCPPRCVLFGCVPGAAGECRECGGQMRPRTMSVSTRPRRRR